MYHEDDLTAAEEDKIIEQIAEHIKKNGLETLAILFLESLKPLSYFSGQISRVFVSPFFTLAGDDADIYGNKLIKVFEKKENVEKLVVKIEALKASHH